MSGSAGGGVGGVGDEDGDTAVVPEVEGVAKRRYFRDIM